MNETLAILTKYIKDNGFAPSVRELGELLGVSSPSTVHNRLRHLMDQGLIERVGPRAIRIKGPHD